MSPDDMQRFEITGMSSYGSEGYLLVDCTRCGNWQLTLDEATTLAELVQRAEEHTEVCR